jgi:hypothetical protein
MDGTGMPSEGGFRCVPALSSWNSCANEEIDFFDPQRQRNQREQSEPGRLEQLPESKTKISHHMNNRIEMRQLARFDSY